MKRYCEMTRSEKKEADRFAHDAAESFTAESIYHADHAGRSSFPGLRHHGDEGQLDQILKLIEDGRPDDQ